MIYERQPDGSLAVLASHIEVTRPDDQISAVPPYQPTVYSRVRCTAERLYDSAAWKDGSRVPTGDWLTKIERLDP